MTFSYFQVLYKMNFLWQDSFQGKFILTKTLTFNFQIHFSVWIPFTLKIIGIWRCFLLLLIEIWLQNSLSIAGILFDRRSFYSSFELRSTIRLVIKVLNHYPLSSSDVCILDSVYCHRVNIFFYFANTRHATTGVTITCYIIFHARCEYVICYIDFNIISKDNQYNEIKIDSILATEVQSNPQNSQGIRQSRNSWCTTILPWHKLYAGFSIISE